MRSVAPMLDESFGLRGAVAFSTPLDAGFADLLRGVVGAHVAFYAGARRSASTFLTADGTRLPGFLLPPGLERTLADGRTRFGQATVEGRGYEVAVALLQSIEGSRIGLIAVAVDRQPLVEAQRHALRSLLRGSAAACLFALALGIAFSRALTRPIARLQESASAIARGNLDEPMPRTGRDEIGALASSFAAMAESLRVEKAKETRRKEDLEREIALATAELQVQKQRAEELAVTDGLTGLANRRRFDDQIANEIDRSGRSLLPVSLLMIDVDHFKHYNDAHGHPAGDAVLRGLAEILRGGRRRTDVVARYGGEEFAILLPDVGKEVAEKLAEQVRARTEEAGVVTISVGVATCPADGAEPGALVSAADEALYQAKRSGRNRVARYTPSGGPPRTGGETT